jgi:hypothetical protein
MMAWETTMNYTSFWAPLLLEFRVLLYFLNSFSIIDIKLILKMLIIGKVYNYLAKLRFVVKMGNS